MTQDELEEFTESIKRDKKDHSVSAWIEALNIFSEYSDKGLNEKYFCGGEHDAVYFYVGIETLTPDSEDGRRLIALGFVPDLDSENWMINT